VELGLTRHRAVGSDSSLVSSDARSRLPIAAPRLGYHAVMTIEPSKELLVGVEKGA
jgi:hypothetical protein